MAKKQRQTLTFSVYDRLLGPEYDNVVVAGDEQNPLFTQQVISSIARDLQNLLNTRKAEMNIPDEFKFLKPSILDYGAIDLTTVNARSESEREKYRQSVQ